MLYQGVTTHPVRVQVPPPVRYFKGLGLCPVSLDRAFITQSSILNNMSKTIGEQRVRTDFNPSADSAVDQIKQKSAELINLCDDLKISGKDGRLVSLAQTAFEEAAMWAVKAATS